MSLPRCDACVPPSALQCLCLVPVSFSIADAAGAGDAFARALVRAASLTAGAHSRVSFFVKQMTGPQCARGKCFYAVTMCLAKRPTRALYVHEVGPWSPLMSFWC